MSFVATGDDNSTHIESVDRLASDGFVLLHQLCSSELVDLMLDVSLRRARALRKVLGEKEIGIGSAAGYLGIV